MRFKWNNYYTGYGAGNKDFDLLLTLFLLVGLLSNDIDNLKIIETNIDDMSRICAICFRKNFRLRCK